MCNFVSYFVRVILCIFVFLCDILLPSGVINDDNQKSHDAPKKKCPPFAHTMHEDVHDTRQLHC